MGFYDVDSLDVEDLIAELQSPLFDQFFESKVNIKQLPAFLTESTRRTGILYTLHRLGLIPEEARIKYEEYLAQEYAKVESGLKRRKKGFFS